MTTPDPNTSSTPGFWGTVWSTLKTMLSWILMKVAAPGVALLIVIAAIVLLSMGLKNLQIGGLLQKLLSGWLGKGSAVTPIAVANSVPTNRVDPTGKVIPQGTPDAQGDTQAVVVPIDGTGGLFSNPSTVQIQPPGSNAPVTIELPKGVQANDVDKVVIVQPGQFVVTVKDNSGVSAQSIDDVLKRYGG